jgi:hypothetical protein
MSQAFLEESIDVLQRTPAVLEALLRGLDGSWTSATEGPDTWSPYDVLGHLIQGERTDWIARLSTILEHGPARPFEPFDREAQFGPSRQVSLGDRLDEFRTLRAKNLETLRQLKLTTSQLKLEGAHPALGRVNLRQLLATWTAHDLAHIVQITRTMARRYREEVGPWSEYLSVMK